MDPKNPSTVKTDNSFRRKGFWKSTNSDQSHTQMVRGRTVWLDLMRKYFRLAKPSQSVEQLFPSRGLGWKSVILCTYSGVKVPIVDLRWLWWQSRGELVLEHAWRNCLTVGKYWCKQAGDWDTVSQAPRPSPTPSYPCLNQSASLACSEALGSQDTPCLCVPECQYDGTC